VSESEWVSKRVSECVRKCVYGRGKEIDRKTGSLDTQTEIKRETGVKKTID
jgi:hypothetical protein